MKTPFTTSVDIRTAIHYKSTYIVGASFKFNLQSKSKKSTYVNNSQFKFEFVLTITLWVNYTSACFFITHCQCHFLTESGTVSNHLFNDGHIKNFSKIILVLFVDLSKHSNSTASFTYDLPYRVYLLYRITNINIYICTYVSQIPILYTIAFTQTAMDCLTLTVTSHLCGQLRVLSIRIANINLAKGTVELYEAIRTHQKLIKYVYFNWFFPMKQQRAHSYRYWTFFAPNFLEK